MFKHNRSWSLMTFTLLVAATAACMHAEEIAWQNDFVQARQVAQQQDKPLLIHFWSESCGPCKKLDQYVFPNPAVARAVTEVVPVKVNTREQRKLAKSFGIQRIPTDIIIAPDGRELWRGISPSSANEYIEMVQRAAHFQQEKPKPGSFSGLAEAARRSDPNFVGQLGYAESGQSPERSGAASSPRSKLPPVNPYVDQQNRDDRQHSTYVSHGGSFQPGGGQFRAEPAPADQATPQPSKPAQASSEASQVNSPVESKPNENPYFDPQRRAAAPAKASSPSKPPQTQQIASKPKFALDGYCPVALLEERRWVKGDPRWGVVHRGQTFLFASEANAKKFWTAPDAFSPMLSGYDPVKLADGGQWVLGRRQFGVFFKDQRSGQTTIVLFSDEAALQRFWQAPEQYNGHVQQALRSNGQGRLR